MGTNQTIIDQWFKLLECVKEKFKTCLPAYLVKGQDRHPECSKRDQSCWSEECPYLATAFCRTRGNFNDIDFYQCNAGSRILGGWRHPRLCSIHTIQDALGSQWHEIQQTTWFLAWLWASLEPNKT